MEKALKALFILKKQASAGQTHSLIYLAEETGVPETYYPLLRSLTPAFVTSRYPDVAGEIPYRLFGEEKVAGYINNSSELIKWAENQIRKQ